MDFLHQVLHDDKKLIESLSCVIEGMQTADDESELEKEILADRAEINSNDGNQPSSSGKVHA